MQRLSTFLLPAFISAMRQQTICDFIEELRAARALPVLSAPHLEAAGFAWDKTLAPIHKEFLESRDADSLFVEAARRGYSEAAQVWDLWQGSKGSQIALDEEAARDAQTEATYRSQAAAAGPNRSALLAFLAGHGIGETELTARASA